MINYGPTLKINKPLEIIKGIPIDIRSYWSSYNDAIDYAQSSELAYEGQIITVKMINGSICTFALVKDKSLTGNFVLDPVGDHISYKMVDELPTEDLEEIIYIERSSNIGYINVDGQYIPLIYPKTDIIDEENPSDKKYTSEKAVKDFVYDKLSELSNSSDDKYLTNIGYDKTTGNINIIKQNSSSNLLLEGLIHNPTYNPDTRTFTFNIFGQESPLVITLGKDIFIDPTKNNRYNPETNNIELYLNDGSSIMIPASNLIDVYTGDSTSTIINHVTEDNKIVSDIRISNKPSNALKIIPLDPNKDSEYGLYVEYIDYQPNIDKALLESKEYSDSNKSIVEQQITNLNKYVDESDSETLIAASEYTDTKIKNLTTTIVQNSFHLSYISKENQTSFELPSDKVYDITNDVVELYINGFKQDPDCFIKKTSRSIVLKTPLPSGYRVDIDITRYK